MASNADVTVMGAGIFGLSCAWELARRGASVRVLEVDHPGAGSSGGVVGALAPHVPENWNPKKAFQLESLLAAEGFWANVAMSGGQDPGYARTGRLQPLADAAACDLARQREESARTLWAGHAEWRVIRAEDASAWSLPSPSGWLVRDTLSARLHPARACAALASALRSLGVPIAQGADAPSDGTVIWATGAAGLSDLSGDLGIPVGQGIKGQAAALGVAMPDAPQLFVDGLHIVPHADGTTAVGSTTERIYDSATATDAQLDDVIARARDAVPALRHAPVVQRWAGLRPRARSRAPMLGPWPGRPGHFLCNGGFKIGFGMAPGLARVMADLILNGEDAIPDGFRVEDSM